MTKMKDCCNCGNKISVNAEACPACGAVTATVVSPDKRPCRTCSKPLEVGKHRWGVTRTYEYMSRGNSHTGETVDVYHAPCPHCGEPQPHQKPIDTDMGVFTYYLFALPVVFALGWASFEMFDSGIVAFIVAFVALYCTGEMRRRLEREP